MMKHADQSKGADLSGGPLQRPSLSRAGFGLVEIIVAASVVAVMLFSIAGVSRLAFGAVEDGALDSRANFLLEEGIEAVKLMRDMGWSDHFVSIKSGGQARFQNGVIYYPVFSSAIYPNGAWTLSANDPGTIDGLFTRTVVFSAVNRCTPNGSATDNDIEGEGVTCPAGSAVDSGTRLVTESVTWQRRGGSTRNRTIKTYLANVFLN